MSDQASDGGSGASRDGGSGGTPTRPRLRDFWTDLPREGKFLLSTIIIDFIGTGLVMPFLVVYLHEVRGFPLDHVGVLASIPAVVSLIVLGPTGHVIDRLGARRVIIASGRCGIPTLGPSTRRSMTLLRASPTGDCCATGGWPRSSP